MPLFGAIHNFAIGVIIFLTRVIWHFGYIRIPIQLTTLSPALVATLSITFYTRCSGGCLCTCAGVRSLMPRWDTHTYSFVDDETCLSDALCSICVSGPGAWVCVSSCLYRGRDTSSNVGHVRLLYIIYRTIAPHRTIHTTAPRVEKHIRTQRAERKDTTSVYHRHNRIPQHKNVKVLKVR